MKLNLLKSQNTEGTIIGSQVKLMGILKDQNNIMIHGQVEGEVHSNQKVEVGPGAEIKGPLSAKQILVSGKVTGSLAATESLEISSSGIVVGSISTRLLTIKQGAVLAGKCEMSIPQQTKKSPEVESKPEISSLPIEDLKVPAGQTPSGDSVGTNPLERRPSIKPTFGASQKQESSPLTEKPYQE